MPRLSICIPTYNRASNVAQTVRLVAQQSTDAVEIVLSNNGSTDDTAAQLQQVVTEFPKVTIRVVHQPKNLGFDRNVLAVVAAAEGDYCWLLSDDDGIFPGGVAAILQYLDTQPATNYVLNFQRYDATAQKVTAERMVSLSEDLVATQVDQFYFYPTPRPSYFQILGTNMITMSINVFQRSAWQQALPRVQEYIGKNFIHIFTLAVIMKQATSYRFIAQPWVRYLSNHHRSWDNDIWADYKAVFLPFLANLGYSAAKVKQVQTSSINYRTLSERMLSLVGRNYYLNILHHYVRNFGSRIARSFRSKR